MGNTEPTTSHMDANLEASSRDCESVETEVIKDLLEADSAVISLTESHKVKAEGEVQITDHVNIDIGSTESIAEGDSNGKRRRKRTRWSRIESPTKDSEISVPKESSSSALQHDKLNDETVMNEGQCSAEGGRIFPSNNLVYCTRTTPAPSVRRKLIVLDVNGLLASIVMPAPMGYRADGHILGRAIFKRPFCDDFLKFCFQNFDVAVWSSRSRKIVEPVVDFLLGEQKNRLRFCWDMYHSTQTGFNTLENVYKPLVFKELRKIWENDDPSMPWKNGDFNESNTLLLDDSPYKALLNPLHTAIFPNSYHYKDSNDNSLGPGGDLRIYLEGLLQSESVQKYVEQHPFGQSAINENNLSWAFYSGVLQNMSARLQDVLPVPNLR